MSTVPFSSNRFSAKTSAYNFTFISAQINEVLTLIDAGGSSTLELKSTMRTNLKTSKVGKKIVIAWKKTVVALMNSDGGIQLIGVDDVGEIIGNETDNFENEDKCLLHIKNLFNHYSIRNLAALFIKR